MCVGFVRTGFLVDSSSVTRCNKSKTGFCVTLDFLVITGYTSSNLKLVSSCSTLWKRYRMHMSLRHRAQLLKMLKRRKCRLFHPIDGPGVVLLKNLSSSSHRFRGEEFF